MSKQDLTPPDYKQCQAEKPNPEWGPFRLGPMSTQNARMIRCSAVPSVVVTEKVAGPDGLRGSMALCTDCLAVLNTQQLDFADVEVIGGLKSVQS